MTDSPALIDRLRDRAERDPAAFTLWELDRLDEWGELNHYTDRQRELLEELDERTT